MLLMILLAVAIGVSLGLLGGGGSILTLPFLVYVVGLETKSAIATSLLVVGATSLAAVTVHARSRRVRWRVGLSFGASSMMGAFAGGHLSRFLPGVALLAGFTGVMVVTGVMMLRPPREISCAKPAPLARAALIGVLVGALTGLVGAGGGFVIVPALALLCGLPMSEAIATSLLVIAMNSFAGFAGYAGHVHVDASVAAMVSAAAVCGGLTGAFIAGRARPQALRKGFAIVVLAMAAVMTFRQLPVVVRMALVADPRLTHAVAAALGAAAMGVLVRRRGTSAPALVPSLQNSRNSQGL